MNIKLLELSLLSKLNVLLDIPAFILSRFFRLKKNNFKILNKLLENDNITPYSKEMSNIVDSLLTNDIYMENENQKCQVTELFGENYFGGPFLIVNSIARDYTLRNKSYEYTSRCLHCGKCNKDNIDIPHIVETLKKENKAHPKYKNSMLKYKDNIAFTNNLFGEKLDESELLDNAKFEYGFFPGCLIQKLGNTHIKKILDILSASGYASFSINNFCCGAPLKWFGLEIEQENNFINHLNNFNFKKIFFSCPHCYAGLKNKELNFEPVFLYEIIKTEFIKEKKEEPWFLQLPCTLRNDKEKMENIYMNLKNSGLNVSTDTNFENFDCCGGGGGYILLKKEKSKSLTIERLKNIKEQGVLTMCPWCNLTMGSAGFKTSELYELC